MGLSGDFGKLKRLQKKLASFADQDGEERDRLAGAVNVAVKGLLKEEFSQSIDVSGSPWERTAKGKPALLSRKLPNAFRSRIDRGTIRYYGKTKRDILSAHQHGHTFPPRRVGEHQHYLTFNRKGKLVATRRIFRKDGTVRPGAYQRFMAAHTVGQRVLPSRKIVPDEGTLPDRWNRAIRSALTAEFQRWGTTLEK